MKFCSLRAQGTTGLDQGVVARRHRVRTLLSNERAWRPGADIYCCGAYFRFPGSERVTDAEVIARGGLGRENTSRALRQIVQVTQTSVKRGSY